MIFSIPPFSHNVDAKQNIVVIWILRIMNVLMEKNGVWYIIVATSNKLLGAFLPKVELVIFLDIISILLKINTP